MATIQGEFETEADAARAIDALRAAGIGVGQVRKWNIIPERPKAEPRGSSVGRSAVVGYLIGGTVGATIGAAAGAAKDALLTPHTSMPDTAGVRLVVEATPTGPDVSAILLRCGARNVR